MSKYNTVIIRRSEMGTRRLSYVDPEGQRRRCLLGQDAVCQGATDEEIAGLRIPEEHVLESWNGKGDWDTPMAELFSDAELDAMLPRLDTLAPGRYLGTPLGSTTAGTVCAVTNDSWEASGATVDEFIEFIRPIFKRLGRRILFLPDK